MTNLPMLELTPTAALAAHAAAGSGPPLSLTAVLALTCCAVGLVVSVLVLGLLLSLRRSAEDRPKDNKAPRSP